MAEMMVLSMDELLGIPLVASLEKSWATKMVQKMAALKDQMSANWMVLALEILLAVHSVETTG
jgi:hypothetical protein